MSAMPQGERRWRRMVRTVVESHGLTLALHNTYGQGTFHVQASGEAFVVNWWPFSNRRTANVDHLQGRKATRADTRCGISTVEKFANLIRLEVRRANPGCTDRAK